MRIRIGEPAKSNLKRLANILECEPIDVPQCAAALYDTLAILHGSEFVTLGDGRRVTIPYPKKKTAP